MDFVRRVSRVFALVTALVALGSSPSSAIEPPAVVVKWYVQIRYWEAMLLYIPDAIQAIHDSRTVTRHPFYKGNTTGGVITKLVDDYINEHFKDVSNWWNCLDWEFEGLCYYCDWPDCSIDDYKSYYYPVQTYEFTNKVFVSEYLAKPVFNLIGQKDLKDYWYKDASKGAVAELKRAAKAIGGHVSASPYQVNFPSAYNNILNANTAEQMEWRVVSTLAQTSYNYPVPGDACHAHVNLPQPVYSEAPYLIDFTRLESKLNLIPTLMPIYWIYQQKLGAKLPMYGLGTNVALGLTSQNLFNTHMVMPIPNLAFATPHIGTDVGVTNMKGNEYTKKWMAQLLRSNHFGGNGGIFPQIFPIQKYSAGRQASRFQWHSPKWRAHGCQEELPIHPLDSYGSFLDLNLDFHPEYDSIDEGRATVTQWQWMRCCAPGYDVLYGDTPQYKY